MKSKTDSLLLLTFQILCHLSVIPALLFFDINYFYLTLIVYFITGCLGLSITFHRLLSHKSWKPKYKIIEYIGSIFGCYGLVGSPIAWVAVHRKHHGFTDKDNDPHTPKNGILKAQFLSMLYVPEIRYVPDLLRQKFYVFTHKYYFLFHAIIFLIFLLLDFKLLIFAYLLPNCILWNMGSLINTLNHSSKYGYINFTIDNNSKNNVLTGFLTWGEGWHNNHHYNSKSFNFGVKKHEYDISASIINILKGE